MEEISKVKNDLRQLRKNLKAINDMTNTEIMHTKRLKMLMAQPKSELVREEADRIMKILETIDAKRMSSEIKAIESKYMDIIKTLPPLDRTLILDCYINGEPYWKIGLRIGYSREGVRKRIYKIIEKIASCV